MATVPLRRNRDLLAGVAADHWNRKRLLIAADGVRAVDQGPRRRFPIRSPPASAGWYRAGSS